MTAVLTPVCTPDLMDLKRKLNSEPISMLTPGVVPEGFKGCDDDIFEENVTSDYLESHDDKRV